jgi:hypothetical protein
MQPEVHSLPRFRNDFEAYKEEWVEMTADTGV